MDLARMFLITSTTFMQVRELLATCTNWAASVSISQYEPHIFATNCLQLVIFEQLKSQDHNNNLKSSQQNWSTANMVFGVTGLIICVGNFIAACLLIHGVREVTTSLNYYVDKEYFDDMLTHHWIFCIKRWAIFQSTFIWSISTLLQANQVLAIPWIVLTIISLIFGLANLIRSIHSLVLFIGLGSTFWRWSSCW